jgi:murein DD-endopeptidase MepM/ murein hydrolase activator NlpD
MNRRTGIERWRGIAAAIALVSPLLLAGCADDGPYGEDYDLPQAAQYTVVAHPTVVAQTTTSHPARNHVKVAKSVRTAALEPKVAVSELPPLQQQQSSAVPTPRPDAAPVIAPDDDLLAAEPAAPQSDVPDTAPAKSAPAQFAWPVMGQILSPFGRDSNGARNDGINIAAKLGAPIHAAAAGTVTYVGNELKSYGNLILIAHGDGYVTAYAHADSIAVNRGDHVNQGQVIGTAGDTGDVDRPQLHFEIRKGVQPVNPRRLLAAELPANREFNRE